MIPIRPPQSPNSPRRRLGALIVFALVLTAPGVRAGDFAPPLAEAGPAPDKSGYHLFNPTPRNLMRDMSTDRPDKTESAHTVDAGHYQIETDILNLSREWDREGRSDSWSAMAMNLKAGLTNRIDLQLVLESYIADRLKGPGGEIEDVSGFGDTTLRMKFNLWGNDGGRTAMALMPYVKFPTSKEGLGGSKREAGLIAPLAIDLGRGWNLGLMLQGDAVEDADGGGHHPEFVQSATVSHAIVGELSGYAEIHNTISFEDGSEYATTFDLGLTYGLTPDVQLDAGINIGLNEAADALQPFLGFTVRF